MNSFDNVQSDEFTSEYDFMQEFMAHELKEEQEAQELHEQIMFMMMMEDQQLED